MTEECEYGCTACAVSFPSPLELAEHVRERHDPQLTESDLEAIRRNVEAALSRPEPELRISESDVELPRTSDAFSARVERLRTIAARAVASEDGARLEAIAGELANLAELARTFRAELDIAIASASRLEALCHWVIESLPSVES